MVCVHYVNGLMERSELGGNDHLIFIVCRANESSDQAISTTTHTKTDLSKHFFSRVWMDFNTFGKIICVICLDYTTTSLKLH